MNPLLKTPPGRSSKFSSSMARSMRALILVTLETSSSESSFFSRALRNLSPNSPTFARRGWEHHRTCGVGLPLPRVQEEGNQSIYPENREGGENLKAADAQDEETCNVPE